MVTSPVEFSKAAIECALKRFPLDDLCRVTRNRKSFSLEILALDSGWFSTLNSRQVVSRQLFMETAIPRVVLESVFDEGFAPKLS